MSLLIENIKIERGKFLMQVANWDDFNKKNKDKTKAFEDLCRLLFLREKKKSSYEYDYDMNEAGLEFKPVKCNDGKWYGI